MEGNEKEGEKEGGQWRKTMIKGGRIEGRGRTFKSGKKKEEEGEDLGN